MDRRRLQCFLYLTFWLFWLVRNCLFYLMKIPTNIQIYDPWSQLVIQVHLQVQKEVSACLTSTTENWLVTPGQGEEVRGGEGGEYKNYSNSKKEMRKEWEWVVNNDIFQHIPWPPSHHWHSAELVGLPWQPCWSCWSCWSWRPW